VGWNGSPVRKAAEILKVDVLVYHGHGAAVVQPRPVLNDDRPDHHAHVDALPAGGAAGLLAVHGRQFVPRDKGGQLYPTVIGREPLVERGGKSV